MSAGGAGWRIVPAVRVNIAGGDAQPNIKNRIQPNGFNLYSSFAGPSLQSMYLTNSKSELPIRFLPKHSAKTASIIKATSAL